jgi:hypothetical protein
MWSGAWTAFILLGMDKVSELLWTRQRAFGLHKMGGNFSSWVTVNFWRRKCCWEMCWNEVLMAVTVESVVLSYDTPCGLVNRLHSFEGVCCFLLQEITRWNILVLRALQNHLQMPERFTNYSSQFFHPTSFPCDQPMDETMPHLGLGKLPWWNLH